MSWRHMARKAQALAWSFTKPFTVGVRALLIRGTEVVLVKHTYQREWYLPGGRVEKRESIDEAMRRELREELGCVAAELELFGVYSNFYESKSDHVIVFRVCEFELGEVQRSEIEEMRFFSTTGLPNETSPGSRRRIEELLLSEPPIHGLW